MSVRWDDLEAGRYEDMVSVLLSRVYPEAQRIDGKGGDGGRDVQIVHRSDGRIAHAFELKSFTGRVTRNRRRQVERSLKRAEDLRPEQWTLVVPIDPTPEENKWFRALGADYGFPIDWYGKTWLDEKMSAFPDIRRYFVEGAKDEVYRLLREIQHEQARITEVPEGMARLRMLRQRLNEIDPYYRYEMATVTAESNRWPPDVVFSVWSENVRVDVYSKYSGAVEDRPVSLSFTLALEPEDLAIRDSLGYGQEVTILDRMISDLVIDAPAGLGGSFTGAELDLFPIDSRLDEPIAIALDVIDGDDLLASCQVHLTTKTVGLQGAIYNGTDSTGWLGLLLKWNRVDEELEVRLHLNPTPAMPAALVPLCRWLDALRPPRRLKIRGREDVGLSIEVDRPIVEGGALSEFVEALAYLQELSGIYREMPTSLTNKDAEEIITVAALARGEIIDFTWDSFTLPWAGWTPELEELANGSTRQFRFEYELSLKLEGEMFPIGRIRTDIRSARLDDPEATRRDLVSGVVPTLRLVPGDSDQGQRTLVPKPQ